MDTLEVSHAFQSMTPTYSSSEKYIKESSTITHCFINKETIIKNCVMVTAHDLHDLLHIVREIQRAVQLGQMYNVHSMSHNIAMERNKITIKSYDMS